MAIGKLPKKMILQKLKNREYQSSQERTLLLEELLAMSDVRVEEIAWTLFIPDPLIRRAGEDIIRARQQPNTLTILLEEMKGKPQTAKRNMMKILPTLELSDLAQQVAMLFQDREEEVREMAQFLLLELPVTRENFPLFRRIIDQGTTELRIRALEKIKEIGGSPIQKIARELVTDDNEKIRQRAYEILISVEDKRNLKLYLERVVSETPTNREILSNAIAKLSESIGEQVLDDVLSLLSSGNDVLRRTVMDILVKMPNQKEVIRHYIDYSRTLLGWVRTRALESMRDFGDDLIEPILQLMDDPDPDIRATALIVGGSFQDKRILPKVCQFLNDPDWWTRVGAADILGRIGDSAAVPALLKALEDPDVRWSAIDALGKLKDMRAMKAIIDLTHSPEPELRVEAIQALSNFPNTQAMRALETVAKTDPIKNIKVRAFELMKQMSTTLEVEISDRKSIEDAVNVVKREQGEPRMHLFLIAARQKKASDFHLSVGSAPQMRIDGKLIKVKGDEVTPELSQSLFREILDDRQWQLLMKNKQLDFCYYIPNIGRYRANVFLDQKGYNGVFRVIPDTPPTINEIGLPSHLHKITHFHQGLIIVCGPSGSGKSTTLAALVNLMNESKRDHIITLEDPIEVIHPFKNCLVNQRAIGLDSESFATALRAALREDPDVIVIGELRDAETASLALTAAETGHIVFCTMNTTTAHKAIDRLISYYPVDEQPQVRMALSETLKAIIAQMLLPRADEKGRVAAYEIILGCCALGNIIRDDKTYQLPSIVQISKNLGMQSFDTALHQLIDEHVITPEAAYVRAFKKEEFEPMVSREFIANFIH